MCLLWSCLCVYSSECGFVVHFSVLVPDSGLLTTSLMSFDVFIDFESVLPASLSNTTETSR